MILMFFFTSYYYKLICLQIKNIVTIIIILFYIKILIFIEAKPEEDEDLKELEAWAS